MMKRTKKSDALLRDIAKLFVTYSRADWNPLLNELRSSSELQQEIAALIEEVAAAPIRKPTAQRKREGGATSTSRRHLRSDTPLAPTWIHPERGVDLDALDIELRARNLLPDARALKEAYARTGAKEPMPQKRQVAITTLLQRMDQMPTSDFDQLSKAIRQSASAKTDDWNGDYTRWFSLILDPAPKPVQLSDLGTEVLNIMDRAMVRGPRYFTLADEAELHAARKRWEKSGGKAEGLTIIDRFLRAISNAKNSDHDQIQDQRIYDIKSDWRELIHSAE